jgi:hypothetical protein
MLLKKRDLDFQIAILFPCYGMNFIASIFIQLNFIKELTNGRSKNKII